MTDPQPARSRLDAALDGLATTFHGMTAAQDEDNCECHWGSAAELAQLKTPGGDLDPDLLRRTWQAPDWADHASVLRRILPQFGTALVSGLAEELAGMDRAGRAFARGRWQRWPANQAAAVQEFLDAWWVVTLTDPDAVVPAHVVLPMLAEASGRLGRWLDVWAELTGPVPDRRLTDAVAEWEYDLLRDSLPWSTWETVDDDELMCAELVRWLIGHAPARLRSHGAPEKLLHRVRLLELTGPARWDDPHWPDHG
ncbi:hypothetical protein [Micromonospora sp. SL4-19]|uniref:hypothetical protein n=1 Tax=Micromonospora sp. SL4-19 TaxID=3399129 RepID=UPI003A4D83D7